MLSDPLNWLTIDLFFNRNRVNIKTLLTWVLCYNIFFNDRIKSCLSEDNKKKPKKSLK